VIVKVAFAGICGTDLHITEVWQQTFVIDRFVGLGELMSYFTN
jgi:threonine dehydrogenase-like Zn-dependent dehydrogenase